MNTFFDKESVLILLAIFLLTAIVVLTLKSSRPAVIADVRVNSKQVNFHTASVKNRTQPTSLLYSGLWLKQAKITQFDTLRFKSSRDIELTDLAGLCDKTEIRIFPFSSDSYIELSSIETAFSLKDIFVSKDVAISWSVIDSLQYVDIRDINGDSTWNKSAKFSTDDRLYLRVYNCSFLNRSGETLYQTQQNTVEEFDFPVSFAKSYAIAVAISGPLELDFVMQFESSDVGWDYIRDLKVSNVDYNEEERTPEGRKTYRNTISNGSIKLHRYSLDDSLVIQKGNFIKPAPSQGMLNLRADMKNVSTFIKYNVHSLTLGPYQKAEHELVKSRFDVLLEDRTLVIIYTISFALFGLMTKFIINKKKE